MIDAIRIWSRGIIFAVIIAVLVEMILPENNSKKYIKIVIGIFVMYSIISPLFDKLTGTNVNAVIDGSKELLQASSNNVGILDKYSNRSELTIKNIYTENLQKEIQKNIEHNGYTANYVKVKIASDESYNIEQVDIKIDEKTSKAEEKQAQSIVETVKHIVVSIDNPQCSSNISDVDVSKIKKIIYDNYGIDASKINIC